MGPYPLVRGANSSNLLIETNLTYVDLNSNHVASYFVEQTIILGAAATTQIVLIQHRGHKLSL